METYLHDALFILFQLCFIVQLYYLVSRHTRLAGHKPAEGPPPRVLIPISVIISARNEARNLEENLPSILEQNYPDFEVVVINDCSFDTSDEVLETMQKNTPTLKLLPLPSMTALKPVKSLPLL
ncbi:glycosyltransferase family 2 protein [Mucilaginibacter sp. P19]|uniref:glycosyltransferase family 2 protein n=1 Tax=Mucilaginibacter sp. P19 TaxID=3423947 RepID=UPI003D66E185